MTWQEAIAYADSTIDKLCADQGIPVEVSDPAVIALTVRYLKLGKLRHESDRKSVV